MNYLQIDKLSTHLKLRRKLVQFVGIGQYFESKTFNYLELFQNSKCFETKLVQVLDYEYGFFPSMKEFETVEELEPEILIEFSGDLKECLEWANNKYECTTDKWSLDLIDIYSSYVDKEILGQSSDHI